MRIYKFVHAAVALEEQGRTIVFDPGSFSFPEGGTQPGNLQNVDALFITHSHSDHYSPDNIRAVLATNPQAVVYTNQQIVDDLARQGVSATAFEQGSITVGPFTVEALAADHDDHLISKGMPTNIAYRVNQSVVHPGDSFSEVLHAWASAPVLLTPIVAPWQNEAQLYDFVSAMKPQRSIPIHDGIVQDFYREGRYQSYVGAFAELGVTFIPLGPDTSTEI